MESTCTVTINDYSQAGDVWCAACNSVAENSLFCSPDEKYLPTNYASIDVQGRPMSVSNSQPMVMQQSLDETVVSAEFCADPEPTPPRDIWLSVNDQRVEINQQTGNLFFTMQRVIKSDTLIEIL